MGKITKKEKIGKVFDLESTESFTKANKFKARLENKGFRVFVRPEGFNSVRIFATESGNKATKKKKLKEVI